MTPSRVRADLLGEHFELRRLIEEARVILRSGNDAARVDLPAAVERLADALHGHSQHEEAAFRVVLATGEDRRGARRARVAHGARGRHAPGT